MKRFLLLSAFVLAATFAAGSEPAGVGGAAAPREQFLYLTPSGDLGAVDANGGRGSSECCRGNEEQVLAWSPDGTRLAFLGSGRQSGGVAAIDGSFFTGLEGVSPVWSPDGRRLAFLGFAGLTMTDRNGEHVVKVRTTAEIASLIAWVP
jgi:Tol biopolymer transport system component